MKRHTNSMQTGIELDQSRVLILYGRGSCLEVSADALKIGVDKTELQVIRDHSC